MLQPWCWSWLYSSWRLLLSNLYDTYTLLNNVPGRQSRPCAYEHIETNVIHASGYIGSLEEVAERDDKAARASTSIARGCSLCSVAVGMATTERPGMRRAGLTEVASVLRCELGRATSHRSTHSRFIYRVQHAQDMDCEAGA